ncbi:MAG TPA: polyribonucleotide nucleotidyltransferase [Saprospiraceae bacterium]|nr:polyribonucleotide nucleotidyltransferase [Saprospiraceae bacterium]
MGNFIPTSVSFFLPNGQEVIIETGKLATQAHGSAVVKIGKTMLLATVVSNKEAREGQGFFPLSVDYQEKFAAVGRIPGNFFRREARLSDYEILISRLVDRAVRPLFPDGYMNETQIIINLISGDKETTPDCYACLAASAALSVSDIPWAGPISEVRVAKINGEHVINPPASALKNATIDIIVAATKDNVMMVEGEAKECQESELTEAIKFGHDAIKIQCDVQLELAQKVGALEKRSFEPEPDNEELIEKVKAFAEADIRKIATAGLDKVARKEGFQNIEDQMIESFTETMDEEWMEAYGSLAVKYLENLIKEVVRDVVLSTGIRLDGRKGNEVRPIWCEVDYLPSAHGSAIFNRGETQSLTSLTLGTKSDQMMIDNAIDNYYENFILHYNFPPLSVGEVRPLRGPGRREVGHANLAARSLKNVLPEGNPYTIRVVSDILESNGSSSMATVCAGSLALMDSGVQIKKAVSGIAMGLISDGKRTVVLSDILGDEDALGDMDFKITGTFDGITACQMDIKIEGLPYETLEKALMQAKEGRIHILNEMNKALSKPREDLKPHAPRIVEIIIDKSFIGAVIGPGGKIIQELQERTGTIINIEEVNNQGVVSISSNDKDSIEKALAAIRKITFTPTVGDVYDAVVASVMPYGVFVDFHGKSGLLHVSEISHTRIDDVSEVFQEGDPVKVKLIGVDSKTGKMKLSRKVLMPPPNRNTNS